MKISSTLQAKMKSMLLVGLLGIVLSGATFAEEKIVKYQPKSGSVLWPSEPPENIPFEQSKELVGILFTGKHSDYRVADTWYPSWASDDNLYSPWTDGTTDGIRSSSGGPNATTGQAIMIGNDPLNLKIKALGLTRGNPHPYQGRYPCGSLVYNGIWYYGTYCLGPAGSVEYNGMRWNWPVLGPIPGFRISTDFGKTWTESPHTPDKPLFPEPAEFMGPVKIGSPKFVDFGKNMRYSPDEKAYLVGYGAEKDDPMPRYANLSWISGDQIYLTRVVPGIENINDESKYEYFAGHNRKGKPIWSYDFEDIKPLLEWNNNMGCVTITYNAPLKKYLMCITDGWPTVARMNSYILESDKITGPWKLVTYMKGFGEQGYFLNFPSKFISEDGYTLWLCYSANFSQGWNNIRFKSKPAGSRYGLVLQETRLLNPNMLRKFKKQKELPIPKRVPRLQIIPMPYNQASFQRDGVEVTRYHFGPGLHRPFLFPVIGPSGYSLTRMGHPHDPESHSHHNSVWISHNDVNGTSFWSDRGGGKIRHKRIVKFEDTGECSSISTENEWITSEGKVLLLETRKVTVLLLENSEWLLIIDTEFKSKNSAVTLGKTPFGMIGVRMAKTIGVNDGGGRIRNSNGAVNEKEVLWKQAKWVDYSGAVTNEKIEGITLFDHPDNPNFPTYFHVRNDGWMGASLTFDGPKKIRPNKVLHLRYGLYIHSDMKSIDTIESQWKQFTQIGSKE